MNRFFYFAILLCISVCGKSSNLQVVGVSRTPEPENTEVVISIPENGDIETAPIYFQIRVEGFSLGSLSNFPRNEDIYNYPMGQNLRIIIDDMDFFAKTGPKIDALQDQGNYYQSMYQIFKLPFKLSPGKHFIRVFLARSFGESLKTENAFAAGYFYFENKKGNFEMDLEKPYLTYNEPDNSHKYKHKVPILLDFLVRNCSLSKDGYKVKLNIDGRHIRYLTFPPYYIHNLFKGEHTIELTLVDRNKKPVSGSYNQVKRIIRVF